MLIFKKEKAVVELISRHIDKSAECVRATIDSLREYIADNHSDSEPAVRLVNSLETEADALLREIRDEAHRFAVNTVVQGSAADLIKRAMIEIQQRITSDRLPVRLILQVHDELVFELPTAEVDTHRRWIVEAMNHALDLSVPLKVDVSAGPNWLK